MSSPIEQLVAGAVVRGPILPEPVEVITTVEDQSIKAVASDSPQARALSFTMAMLQRRFASGLYAARRSLERMRDRRERILEKLGYDVESRVPETGRLRFVEVRGNYDYDFAKLLARAAEAPR